MGGWAKHLWPLATMLFLGPLLASYVICKCVVIPKNIGHKRHKPTMLMLMVNE